MGENSTFKAVFRLVLGLLAAALEFFSILLVISLFNSAIAELVAISAPKHIVGTLKQFKEALLIFDIILIISNCFLGAMISISVGKIGDLLKISFDFIIEITIIYTAFLILMFVYKELFIAANPSNAAGGGLAVEFFRLLPSAIFYIFILTMAYTSCVAVYNSIADRYTIFSFYRAKFLDISPNGFDSNKGSLVMVYNMSKNKSGPDLPISTPLEEAKFALSGIFFPFVLAAKLSRGKSLGQAFLEVADKRRFLDSLRNTNDGPPTV